MKKEIESNEELSWYVSIHSNDFNRKYAFKSEKLRNEIYNFIIDISLRNCCFEINDCKFGEKVLFKTSVVITAGKEEINLIDGLEVEFYEKDDLVITAMGFRNQSF